MGGSERQSACRLQRPLNRLIGRDRAVTTTCVVRAWQSSHSGGSASERRRQRQEDGGCPYVAIVGGPVAVVAVNPAGRPRARRQVEDATPFGCCHLLACALNVLTRRAGGRSRHARARIGIAVRCGGHVPPGFVLPAVGRRRGCLRTGSAIGARLVLTLGALQPAVRALCRPWECDTDGSIPEAGKVASAARAGCAVVGYGGSVLAGTTLVHSCTRTVDCGVTS